MVAYLLLVILMIVNSFMAGHLSVAPAAPKAENYTKSRLEQAHAATRLQSLVRDNTDTSLLPEGDADDPRSLPKWYRIFLRRTLAALPKSGRPQYPKEAVQLLQWLEAHPNFSDQDLAANLARLRECIPQVIRENEQRAKYPREWELEIPKGTKLDRLRKNLEDEFAVLPAKDLEDRTPLPIWFRVYLRKKFPELSNSGPYQYPRTAAHMLRWMLAHPNSFEEEKQ